MSDKIMDLHWRGASARQIAERTGRSRNAVIGYIWRYKKRNGPPARELFNIPHETILAAIAKNGGSVPRAAKALGTSPKNLWCRGYKSASWMRNASTDPLTHRTVAAIDASGLPDYLVAEGAGIGCTTIQSWRRGRKGHKFLLECVLEYLEKNTPGY